MIHGVTTSGITSEKEWQRVTAMTRSGNFGQFVCLFVFFK